MKQYLKFIPYVLLLALLGILIYYVPVIERWQKLNRLKELGNVWNTCEQQQLDAQTEAKVIREELGLSQTNPEAVSTGTVKTWTQADELLNQYIE